MLCPRQPGRNFLCFDSWMRFLLIPTRLQVLGLVSLPAVWRGSLCPGLGSCIVAAEQGWCQGTACICCLAFAAAAPQVVQHFASLSPAAVAQRMRMLRAAALGGM